jgi:hypothetical protein
MDIPDLEAADQPYVLIGPDGKVGVFGDAKTLRATFDQSFGHRCLPPDQSSDRTQDSMNVGGEGRERVATDRVSVTGETVSTPQIEDHSPGEAVANNGDSESTSSDLKLDSEIDGEGEKTVTPRDLPPDSIIFNNEAQGPVRLPPGDQCPDLASVAVEAPAQLEERSQVSTGDKDAPTEPLVRRGISFGHRWAVARPKTLPRDRKRSRHRSKDAAPNPTLVVTVEPSWGDQRIFQHYRARLRELYDGGAATAALVPRFREINQAIEARLRQRLPHLIGQLDALYAEARHGR